MWNVLTPEKEAWLEIQSQPTSSGQEMGLSGKLLRFDHIYHVPSIRYQIRSQQNILHTERAGHDLFFL